MVREIIAPHLGFRRLLCAGWLGRIGLLGQLSAIYCQLRPLHSVVKGSQTGTGEPLSALRCPLVDPEGKSRIAVP